MIKGMNNWKNIWEKRNIIYNYDNLLSELIRLDGFDGKTGKIELSSWIRYINFIVNKIEIKKSDSIFEIGAGSGAFLYPFHKMGYNVEGIDYSESLVQAAKKLWNAPIRCQEAIQVPVLPLFDIVLSNSVFFYFPDLDYAEQVIKRMIEKSKRIIAILEVPDKALYNASEEMRKSAIGDSLYLEKYKDLQHLYYDREWMKEIGDKYNLDTEIFDQNIEGYNSNLFRFNCIFRKK